MVVHSTLALSRNALCPSSSRTSYLGIPFHNSCSSSISGSKKTSNLLVEICSLPSIKSNNNMKNFFMYSQGGRFKIVVFIGQEDHVDLCNLNGHIPSVET